jgi:hypothetical protein
MNNFPPFQVFVTYSTVLHLAAELRKHCEDLYDAPARTSTRCSGYLHVNALCAHKMLSETDTTALEESRTAIFMFFSCSNIDATVSCARQDTRMRAQHINDCARHIAVRGHGLCTYSDDVDVMFRNSRWARRQ